MATANCNSKQSFFSKKKFSQTLIKDIFPEINAILTQGNLTPVKLLPHSPLFLAGKSKSL